MLETKEKKQKKSIYLPNPSHDLIGRKSHHYNDTEKWLSS